MVEEPEFHEALLQHFRPVPLEEGLLKGDVICMTYNLHCNPPSYQHACVYFQDDVVFQRQGGQKQQRFEFTHIFNVLCDYNPKAAGILFQKSTITVGDVIRVHPGHRIYRQLEA
jgi:hypothetical protein